MKGLLKSLKSLFVESWDYSDRRRLLRFKCKREVQVQTSKEMLAGELRDVGVSGLCVLCYGRVKKGAEIGVKIRKMTIATEVDTVTCKVHWVKKEGVANLLGASFLDPPHVMAASWVYAELKELGKQATKSVQDRKGVRVTCAVPARLAFGETVSKAAVRDLGLGGARVQAEGELLEVGATVKLGFVYGELPPVSVNATVVTARGNKSVRRYGLEFFEFERGGYDEVQQYMDHFFNHG